MSQLTAGRHDRLSKFGRNFSCFFELLLLYALALAALLALHEIRYITDPGLVGEELNIGFATPLYFAAHKSINGYHTNYSSHFLFWLFSYIPGFSLETPRIAKIFVMALLGPVGAILLRQLVPQISSIALFLGSILIFLQPAASWYFIHAMENGLECLFGAALLAVTLSVVWNPSARFFKLKLSAIVLLGVWQAHVYPGGLIAIPTAFLILVAKSISPSAGLSRRKSYLLLSFGAALVIMGASWPLWYYHSHISFFTAGGNLASSSSNVLANARAILLDLLNVPDSYLVGTHVLSGPYSFKSGGLLLGTLILIACRGHRQYPQVFWVGLFACVSFLLAASADSMPGIRRAFLLLMSLNVLAAIGYQRLVFEISWSSARYWFLGLAFLASGVVYTADSFVLPIALTLLSILAVQVFWNWRAEKLPCPSTVSLVFILLLLCGPLSSVIRTSRNVSQHYEPWLQRQFTKIGSLNYEESSELILVQMQRNQLQFTTREYSFDVLLMFHLFCIRRELNCQIPRLTVAPGDWADSDFDGLTYLIVQPDKSNSIQIN